jgi:hypothetical protein
VHALFTLLGFGLDPFVISAPIDSGILRPDLAGRAVRLNPSDLRPRHES